MKLYKLPIVFYEPCEDTEYDMYMAEAPLHCQGAGRGVTPWHRRQSSIFSSVAEAFIESYYGTER